MGRFHKAAIGALCGAGAAGLYLAILIGSPGSLILVYLTQLPLFIAGLWLGVGGAALAGGTAAFVLLAASDVTGAALFAALYVVPVLLLVWQALLARRRSDGATEWYPPGGLAAWLTGLGLAGLAIAPLLLGGPSAVEDGLRAVIERVRGEVGEAGGADGDAIVGVLTLVMPGIIAASWMAMTAINGMLAQGLLTRFRASWRPTPDLAALGLPVWIPIVLGLAAGATAWGGTARFFGINAMIALAVPFGLAGLAVLHAAARRVAHPTAVLVGFYVLASLFGWPLLVIAVLGLVESGLGLRRRLTPAPHFGGKIDG